MERTIIADKQLKNLQGGGVVVYKRGTKYVGMRST